MNILYLFLPFSGEKSFFFVSDFNHASCMLTTDLSIDEDAGTPLHTQAFSASFLQLFCLVLVQVTLLLAYLLLPMHMKNDFFLPFMLLPNSGSVLIPAFLVLSLHAPGNLLYSVHSIWAWLLPSVHPMHMLVSLSPTAGTFQHSQSPLATTESCSRFISSVASCCGPPTT